MHEQGGRVLSSRIDDGAGQFHHFQALIFFIDGEHSFICLLPVPFLLIHPQIVWRIPGNDRLDASREGWITVVPEFFLRGVRHQLYQMAACGFSPCGDPLRIHMVLLGIGTQESHCCLAVLYLCRKRRSLAQPVVDAHRRITAPAQFRQFHRRQIFSGKLFVAPASAMYPDHGGQPLFCARRINNIHFIFPAVVSAIGYPFTLYEPFRLIIDFFRRDYFCQRFFLQIHNPSSVIPHCPLSDHIPPSA